MSIPAGFWASSAGFYYGGTGGTGGLTNLVPNPSPVTNDGTTDFTHGMSVTNTWSDWHATSSESTLLNSIYAAYGYYHHSPHSETLQQSFWIHCNAPDTTITHTYRVYPCNDAGIASGGGSYRAMLNIDAWLSVGDGYYTGQTFKIGLDCYDANGNVTTVISAGIEPVDNSANTFDWWDWTADTSRGDYDALLDDTFAVPDSTVKIQPFCEVSFTQAMSHEFNDFRLYKVA